ncbi:MAG TPA: SDR family oxidoreductase [Acidimicrobiales bacterium]|nr:SDR family oxidoreductase [Acidimicrobiales bacterium]
MSRKVAFITGASRGIGKACAVDLARHGYDVAVTARTVTEGEKRNHSSTLKAVDDSPLPGSLNETVAAIEAAGGRAMAVAGDLLDRASLGAAVATVQERWGGIDLVLHNGRYIGPGHMDRFMDTPIELIEKQIAANVIAPLVIDKMVIPGMIERGGGIIVNISSAAAYGDPTKPAGTGGWGMGYGVSKGAFHRIAGFLDVELRDQGILTFSVQPGLIATERIGQDMAKFGIENNGAPMDVVAKVVSWLVTDPEGPSYSGKNVEAQYFCHERGLLPGWGGPTWNENNIRYDQSGATLKAYEESLPRP